MQQSSAAVFVQHKRGAVEFQQRSGAVCAAEGKCSSCAAEEWCRRVPQRIGAVCVQQRSSAAECSREVVLYSRDLLSHLAREFVWLDQDRICREQWS